MCDVNRCALPATQRYGSQSIIDVSAPFLRHSILLNPLHGTLMTLTFM